MRRFLDQLLSVRRLFIVAIEAGVARVYFAHFGVLSPVAQMQGLSQAGQLLPFARMNTQYPWALLVDQTEEAFWGGAMPALSGIAKTVWLKKLAEQSNHSSIFSWSEMQGPSQAQKGKRRAFCHGLTNASQISTWLEALQSAGVRIRGVYSPSVLMRDLLGQLRIRLQAPASTPQGESKSPPPSTISVLITKHSQGLRQTVFVDAHQRFSRLALLAGGYDYFSAIVEQTQRLRSYLLSSGLLENEQASLQIYCLIARRAEIPSTSASYVRAQDTYHWIVRPWSMQPFIHVLARSQPHEQLAAPSWCVSDRAHEIAGKVRLASGLCALGALLYAGLLGVSFWEQYADLNEHRTATQTAELRYREIARTFPPTALTSSQLQGLEMQWQKLQGSAMPDMRSMLAGVGNVLMKFPQLQVHEVLWFADVARVEELEAEEGSGVSRKHSTDPAAAEPKGQDPGVGQKGEEARKKQALVVRGRLGEEVGSGLREMRDTLSRVVDEFNRSPALGADMVRKPVDLSAKTQLNSAAASVAGGERQFELKIWQR